MTIGNAIIQGIIQGLTEFLPVSSSGHLSLIQYFTGQSGSEGALFSVLLHLGTLIAVVIAFWSTIAGLVVEFFRMVGDIFTRRFSWKDANGKRRMIVMLIVAMLPMVITVLLKDWFESLSTDNGIIAEGICFLATSLLLFLSDHCVKGHKNAKNIKFRDAVAVGTMQAIAPLPGLSRSGSTIAAGLIFGLDRKFAVAFSFILGIPAVLGANILKIGDVAKEGLIIPVPALVAGMLCSLVFGLLAIKAVRWLAVNDKFKYFAIYTLVLGVLVIILGIIERATGGMLQGIISNW